MIHPGKIWFGILVTGGLLLLSQCSPHAGKSVLRVFFDGVPEPDSTATVLENSGSVQSDTSASAETIIALAIAENSVHYPYDERDCAVCHNEQSLGSMVEPQPGLCYICHEDLSEQYSYLHGPVAGGYCTACHDPHMSGNQNLLRITGDELCLHCHEKESVLRNEMHEGLEGMLCTDCHNPHGGEDKYIFQ